MFKKVLNLLDFVLKKILQQVLDYQDLDYCDPCNTGIEKKFQVPWLPVFVNNNSSQYHDPDNQGIGFFYYYQEHFLDLVIPIIKDLL